MIIIWIKRTNSVTGEGKLITICHTDSPPAYPIVTQMNFDPSVIDILASLNWATAEEDYVPSMYSFYNRLLRKNHIFLLTVLASSDVAEDQAKSERQKSRLNKRKTISELLQSTRDELFSGEFERFAG